MKQIQLHIILMIICLSACGGSSAPHGKSLLNLTFSTDHPFDPNISPGRIDHYKITISGESLSNTLVQEFSPSAGTVYFDGFAAGATMQILVEALNDNAQVIGRGRTETVVQEDQYTDAAIALKHVPIFTNIYEGTSVYANRFVPKVYAPAGLEFQVMEAVDGNLTALPDVVSGEVSFSISEAEASVSAIRTVHTPRFAIGAHQLTVQDPSTGESSTVDVNVLDTGNVTLLHTTAGDYLGSAYATSENQPTDAVRYFKALTH